MNFVSPNTLSDKFQQIALKFATLSFLSLSFLFLLYKVPFKKNFIVCVIFSNQYPNLLFNIVH